MDVTDTTTKPTDTTAVRELVRHLIRAQVDNADHIHLIAPLTQSHELLLAAAEELFGEPAALIEAKILEQREAIESYRPLVSAVEKYREESERYERALGEIAYEHPAEPARVARRALGAEGEESVSR